MAPEQIETLTADALDVRVPDGRADLFSLGVILFELLTGEQPFGALPQLPLRELAAHLRARQRAGCKPIRSSGIRVDRGLATLVERCLAFDRAARPASATLVATELRRYLASRRRARLIRRGAGLLLAMVVVVAGLAVVPRPPGAAERGRVAFRTGNYTEAERCFGEALTADPNDARIHWARAVTRLKLSELASVKDAAKQIMLAQEAFNSAPVDDHRPEAAACIGYCLSRHTSHKEAIYRYREAEAGGFQPAALYNNLAYSQLALGELDAAEPNIARAIEKDPDLAAAYHNLAFLKSQRWHRKNDKQTAAEGRDAAVAAIERGMRSPDVFFDAANLTVAADGPHALEKAMGYLQLAIEAGKKPDLIKSDILLSQAFANYPGFEEMLATSLPGPVRARNPRLVIPISSLDQ